MGKQRISPLTITQYFALYRISCNCMSKILDIWTNVQVPLNINIRFFGEDRNIDAFSHTNTSLEIKDLGVMWKLFSEAPRQQSMKIQQIKWYFAVLHIFPMLIWEVGSESREMRTFYDHLKWNAYIWYAALNLLAPCENSISGLGIIMFNEISVMCCND